jgi:hypothetical protein
MLEIEHEYGGDLLDFYEKVWKIAKKRFLIN